MAKSDPVNHPAHYGGADNPYEVIKILDAWGLGRVFCLANVVKYVLRAGQKENTSAIEDLEKARWYLDHEINRLKDHEINRLQG